MKLRRVYSGVYLIKFHMKVCHSLRCCDKYHMTAVYFVLHLSAKEWEAEEG
jgi:hypothetical protein